MEDKDTKNQEQNQELEPEFQTEAEKKFEDLIQSIIVDPDAEIEEPPIVISFNQKPICTLGSFSLLIGKAKSRKTFLVTAIAAAVVSGECNIEGLMGSMPPGSVVHYFDTEQSTYHLHKTVRRIIAQAGSSNFKAYGMRPFTPHERLKIIEHVIQRMKHPAFIIIDGLRDLLHRGINDEADATDVTSKFLKWTHEKNCHIMLVLHQNKADVNARGHIGTEAVNKAETVLTITKNSRNKDLTTVTPEFCRNIDFEPFSFMINSEELPEIISSTNDTNGTEKIIAMAEKFETLLAEKTPIPYTDLVTKYEEVEGVSVATAKRRIKTAYDSEVLMKDKLGQYKLKNEVKEDEE